MSRRAVAAGVLAVIAMAAGAALWRGTLQTGETRDADVSAFQIPGTLEDGRFARVNSPWEFRFPADHGAHRDFRTEWWYLTGSVNDDRGKHLGLQLVLVRVGLTAEPQQRSSGWAVSEVFAGLFSISDPVEGRLHTDQRVSRAALGLAGSGAQPMQVWVENWRLAQSAGGEGAVDLSVRVATDAVALNLQLRNRKPIVNANLVRGQGSEASAPFHFYVQPRLRAEGTLRAGTRQMPVDGTVTMEHAWGELPLPGGPVALDRFTLHLDDGRELLCVRRHRVDGSGTPATTGLLIGRDGRPIVLPSAEVELRPTEYWSSKDTGARYPIRWALRVREQGIDLELIPHWENQEGIGWAPFWAGPVRLRGASPTMDSIGSGFVQLNGYDVYE